MRFADFRSATTGATLVTAQRADQFVRNAFDVDKRNTRYVALAKIDPVKRGWRTVTVTKIPGERARTHVQLTFPPDGYRGSLRACRGLRLDCDCGRHQFVWNYALHQADLAIVDRTDSQPAVETNPANVLGCCKHGIIVLRYLQRTNPRFPHTGADDASRRGAVRLTTLRDTRRRP